MRVALVASSFLPEPGRLERRVDQLARGLALRGAEVEVLTQGRTQSTVHHEQVTVRRFPTTVWRLRFAVAPKLCARLRASSDEFDIVDVHSRSALLALAVGSTRVRRLVFTPSGPMEPFLSSPYTRVTHAFVSATTQIICYSESERDVLCRAVPWAADRTRVVPDGVDADALRAATPFATAGVVVLAADRLDRSTGVARAIAAMPSLPSEFRLLIVGDGSARGRLWAYAADLQVSSRVQFVGAVSDAVLYRWLRTAHVVVSLAGEHGSGSLVTEARAAGASVVASDLPTHREAAERSGGGPVVFVAPKGSPLDVADAIQETAHLSVLRNAAALRPAAPSWQSVVDSTWMLYRDLVGHPLRQARDSAAGEVVALPARARGAG